MEKLLRFVAFCKNLKSYVTFLIITQLFYVETILAKPEQDEIVWIRAAQAGDEGAFAQLVWAYHAEVRRYLTYQLHRLRIDRSMVDDLAQEVFLTGFRQLKDISDPSRFRKWLLGIARNKSLEQLRKEATRNKHEKRFAEEHLTNGNDEFESTEALGAKQNALKNCLESLESKSKLLIQQFYFEKQSAEQIAKDMKRKPGTVRMMLMRIRKALGKCIENEL